MKRFTIKFRYADAYSGYKWREQQCSLCAEDASEARYKAIKLYGLGSDCEYEIVSVTEEK